MKQDTQIITRVRSKLHGITVTDASVEYNGSVSIDASLMRTVGIRAYEQVHVINLTNGNRWVTYAIPSSVLRAFTLNGGGAHLGKIGDRCVVMTYRQDIVQSAYVDRSSDVAVADVAFLNTRNTIVERMTYWNNDLYKAHDVIWKKKNELNMTKEHE